MEPLLLLRFPLPITAGSSDAPYILHSVNCFSESRRTEKCSMQNHKSEGRKGEKINTGKTQNGKKKVTRGSPFLLALCLLFILQRLL